MVAVETFAGSANLTAKLELQGFDAFGVDRKANRHVPKAGIIAIDLSTPSGAQLFFTVISDPSVVYVHFCVPSDTLSRARGVRCPPGHGRKGRRVLAHSAAWNTPGDCQKYFEERRRREFLERTP